MKKIKYFLTLKKLSDNTLEEIEVFPYSNIVISGEKLELPRRDYGKKINGNITFIGADYNRILTHFDTLECEPISIRIAEFCGGEYYTIFNGKINNRTGEWDYENCRISINVSEFDKYKCLEDNWENKIPFHSMSSLSQSVDIMPFAKRYKVVWNMKTDRTPVDVINIYELQSNSQTWAQIDSDVTNNVGSNSNTTAIYNTIARRTGSILSPYYDDSSNSAVMRYIQNIALSIPVFTQNIKTYIVYDFGSNIYMVASNTYQLYNNETSNSFDRGYAFMGLGSDKKIVTNGHKLESVLEDLLSRYCGGMTLKSDFFQWNPTSSSSINYVTSRTNELTNLIIFQKSDVKRPNDTNRAFGKSTELSIKFLLENICKMFNCQYHLTDSNVLVIEHLSWSGWSSLMGYSPTKDIRNEFGIQGNNVLAFKSASIPKGEHFEFMEAFNPDFVGVDITYPADCVTDNDLVNINIERITTDVTALTYGTNSMYAYSDLGATPTNKDIEAEKDKVISDDGFVIMATKNTIGNPIWIVDGILLGDEPFQQQLPNNILGWARLHFDYFFQGRYYPKGYMNGYYYSVFSMIKHNAEQGGIFMNGCCNNFTPFTYYITDLSLSAEVSSYEYDVESGNVTFNLTYYK